MNINLNKFKCLTTNKATMNSDVNERQENEIILSMRQSKGSTISLKIQAWGEVDIDGVSEGQYKPGVWVHYTLNSETLSIKGDVIEFSACLCKIDTLDATGNSMLQKLCVSDIGLRHLNVTKNPNLKVLFCPYNELTSLDVTHNPSLIYLVCNGNRFDEVDVSRNMKLITPTADLALQNI